MRKWWVSWWSHQFSSFTLFTPWWIDNGTGGFMVPASAVHRQVLAGGQIVCAAVIADTEAQAKQLVLDAHDSKVSLEWRFVSRQGKYWSPFQERFPRAEWMQWPATEVR